MKLKKTAYIVLITFGLLLGSTFFATAADYILVVNKENPVDSLTHQEVKDIFLGKKTKWGNELPITLVMNTNEEIHERFTRIMLQKSPVQLSVYWKKIL
ncbi:MAG: ABC transporter substrate-binding protein, partial [Proteobacteria bacterium]|nr:ABC transporter substrate-binding protein [Pseudomonadota bacterium]MBU1546521.1 ABC transporter substrate-binding protein [Pseudomonadota bacterium]